MKPNLPNVKDCCKDPNNLLKMPDPKDDVKLFVCNICGSRHFLAKPDKFQVAGRGAALGSN